MGWWVSLLSWCDNPDIINLSINMKPRILLIGGKNRKHHYQDLYSSLNAQWYDELTPKLLDHASQNLDIALVSDEFVPSSTVAICELKKQNIPTLHIVDGITEWRNTWENPRSSSEQKGMPLFQPVLSHKIACLGPSQARLLESWGNLGKCEIVGAPRFDQLLNLKPRQRSAHEPFSILVMTAKTPGFTPRQLELVKQSLLDLKNWFQDNPKVGDITIKSVWRLTKNLAHEIGVEDTISDLTGKDLSQALQAVDAVVTTPSTAMLEAMLCGLPTVLLDYNNCPHYVPSAWTITASPHIGQIIPELVNAPLAKRIYQDTILHDALACLTPANTRMVELIQTMIKIGQKGRICQEPLKFPGRILKNAQSIHHLPEEKYDMAELYPNHPVFSNMNLLALQTEVGHLRLQEKKLRKFQSTMLWKISEAPNNIRASLKGYLKQLTL